MIGKTEIDYTPLDYLSDIPQAALEEIAAVIRNSLKNIKRRSASLAPTDDGFLKKSINYKIKTNKKKQTVFGISGVENKKFIDKNGNTVNPATYAHFTEYGTVNIQAEPFMRPVVNTEVGEDNNKIQNEIAQNLLQLTTMYCEKNNKITKKIK